MKVSVAHHDRLSFRSGGAHGGEPLGNKCRQYLAVDRASMEALKSQDQNHKQHLLCWNHLGSDSSIDAFHPDGTLLPSLNSDGSKLSPQSDSQTDEENLLQPLIDRGPAELSQKEFCLAEVNPTSFEVAPCLHHEHRELQHEQSINLCYPTGNHVQSLSSLPADVDLASSDGEPSLHPTLFISERHCERPSCEEALSTRVRLMCSFGGRIMPRPIDGKLRYAGGETRIVTVTRGISFAEFMSKMAQFYGSPLGLKYQLPDEDLDALISVSSDDDLQNMMEEYDKIESGGSSASRLRLFFFSSPAEVEVPEDGVKMELEDGCAFLEQRYVDAINGVSEKLHGSLLENDVVGFRQADALNNVENSGRMPLHDLANVTTRSKGPSAPSSFPSSPPLAPRQEAYGKPPALGDISLQSLNERLSKVTINSSGFEGDFDQDGSGSSSGTSQHDYQYHQDHQHHEQQFYVAADSPKITHHDLSVSRGDNWPGMCYIDSQTKLTRQSEQYMDYRTSAGGPMDQWHDMQQPSNTLLPQVEYQRFVHQHKHIPQKKHHQHQHQQQHHHHHHHQHQHRHRQAWQLQIDGETGRSEHCVQDIYKQPQVFHQPHHPPACHCSHQIVAANDGSSWNTEHHANPLFFQGSTQNHPQIPHGLAPAPPYQMGSAPASPRDAVHDYQGKCSCGLQHSQVHRGITVSIGDQLHNRWLPHSGDHPIRRHGLLSSSRFCDNASNCAHSSVWQQPSHLTGTDEAEHREQIGNPLQHFHGRHPMDCQLAECQARSRALQYCEPPSNNETFLPSHDRHEANKRSLCIRFNDNRKQPMEKTMVHSAYPGMQDQVTEWVSNQKGFQLDSGRVAASRKDFPRISLHKDEDCRGEFADEKCIEGELELYLSLKPGDFELRRTMETPIDGMPYARKPPIPAVSVSRPLVSEELLVSPPLSNLAQGGPEWHPKLASLKTSAEVPNSWSMTSLEPGVCTDLLPSWHGQASNRLMEEVSELPSSKEMPRGNFDSSSLLMVEGANSSIQTGRFLGKTVHDHGACTSGSFWREDYGRPSASRRAAGEALEPLPASSSGYEFIDAGCDGVRVSATHGDAHLLSPDVIPLGSVAATTSDPHMQQAIPAANLTMNTLDGSLNTPASPVYDQSPLSSTNATDFSFVPSKTRSPPAEANIDNEAFASHMSVTELLADGMISSVLKSCSNEGFLEENKDVDEQVAPSDSHQEPNHLMCENGMEKDTSTALLGLNSLLPSVIEQGKGWSVTEASTVNGWLKVGVQEEISEMGQIMQSDVTKKISYKDEDSKVENSHVGETKGPPLSQAEAEAIARGLQIIRNSDLEDLKELGSGTFGTVYHGKWRGSDVAIKRIKASCFTGPPLEQERLISDFWKEACTLGQLHHPNVVAFYGVVPDGPGGTLATVTEYMVNGSLKQVLHKKDRTIDRRKRLFIAMDAAFGMEYLHSKNIVHFDLKCENLLVNMRDAHRPICKVGDFGLSKVKHQTLVSGGVRGTLPWMAPELLSGNCLVTEKIDVFSFGVVMWELLTGEEPYANLHCGAIISGIVNNTLRPSIPSWCDPRWRNLMEQCWSGNPAERPAFAEVSKELREIYASMNIK